MQPSELRRFREAIGRHLGQPLTPDVAAAIEAAARAAPTAKLQRDEVFAEHLAGNEDAIAFNLQMCDVLHLWDDLIDKDKAVTADTINRGFQAALVDIPCNPFYRRHFDALNPLVSACILSWHTANRWEAEERLEELRLAYVVRSDYINLFLGSVAIVQGSEYAARVAPEVRAYWHGEGWQGYLINLAAEKAAKRGQHGML
jgi:hypothetical protein